MARNGKDQRYFSCEDNLLKDRDLIYTNTKLRRADVQKKRWFLLSFISQKMKSTKNTYSLLFVVLKHSNTVFNDK